MAEDDDRQSGTLIELPADADDEKQVQPAPLSEYKEHMKTIAPAKEPE